MKGLIGRGFVMAALLAGLCLPLCAGGRLNPLWVYWAPDTILFAPTVAWDGSVYIATADSLIRGISPTGVALWSANPGGLPSAAMALQGNMLYFPTSQGELAAYGTDGHLAWRVPLGSELCSTPAISADGTIYETLVKGGVVAMNTQGQILWSYMTSGPVVTSPVITHTGLIFVMSASYCYLFTSNGVPVSIMPLTDAPVSPVALDADDYPYFWGASGNAWSLSQNGGFRWTIQGSTTLITTGASPVVSTSSVFLASALGTPPAKTYNVTGTIVLGLSSGLGGVTVSAGSGNPSTTTASDGTYTLKLANGSYTITPTLTGYAFTPETHSVTVNGADVTGQDFSARIFASPSVESAAGAHSPESTSTVTYNAAAYYLASGSAAWSPLEIGGHYAPVVTSESLLLLPSFGDQKVYLLNQATGTQEGSANVGGPPQDLVLADTAVGTRLVFAAGERALHCFSSTVTPASNSPWTQIGAGPRHLNRRDDPPSVHLTSPAGGTPVEGPVDLAATVSDDWTTNPTVRYLVDGTVVATSATESPVWDTTTFTNGTHVVTAEARDSAGNVSRSTVNVDVQNTSVRTDTVYADTASFTFTWDPGTETKFRVEVATNGAFSPVYLSSKTQKDAWLSTPTWTPSNQTWSKILGAADKAGTADTSLVWRVVGQTGGPMPASGGFLVVKGIVASELGTPGDGDEVSSASPPEFSWTPDHTGLFQVRVSDTPDFKVLRMTSKRPNHHWLDVTAWTPDADKWKRTAVPYAGKTLYWKVISKDAIGRKVESPAFSMQITP